MLNCYDEPPEEYITLHVLPISQSGNRLINYLSTGTVPCILFSKLIERKVPHIVIRLLVHWYSSQTFAIKRNNVLSDPFAVSNSVQQGSVLFPAFFSVCIDSLNVELSASSTGCSFNSKSFNHLVYANDTVLLDPSPKALQSLINICVNFTNKDGLVYCEQKTRFMPFI